MNVRERELNERWPIYDDRTAAGLRLAGVLGGGAAAAAERGSAGQQRGSGR